MILAWIWEKLWRIGFFFLFSSIWNTTGGWGFLKFAHRSPCLLHCSRLQNLTALVFGNGESSLWSKLKILLLTAHSLPRWRVYFMLWRKHEENGIRCQRNLMCWAGLLVPIWQNPVCVAKWSGEIVAPITERCFNQIDEAFRMEWKVTWSLTSSKRKSLPEIATY